jgi:hypothetical protein
LGAKDKRKENWFDSFLLVIQGEHDRDNIVGINLQTGGPLDPQMEGIFDNYSVKRQLINSGYSGTPNFFVLYPSPSLFPWSSFSYVLVSSACLCSSCSGLWLMDYINVHKEILLLNFPWMIKQ